MLDIHWLDFRKAMRLSSYTKDKFSMRGVNKFTLQHPYPRNKNIFKKETACDFFLSVQREKKKSFIYNEKIWYFF